MDRKLLSSALAKFGLELTDTQLDAFELLTRELQRWNKKINLTALRSDEDITIKHLVDSLRLAPLIEQGARLLDMGSGAGFPSLPLAIVRPDLCITSIDSASKKISFQKHIRRLINLHSFEALPVRVEDLILKNPKGYDVVTSRAFSNISLFLELASPLVCDNGKVIAMRGDDTEDVQKNLYSILETAGFEPEETIRYALPHKKGQRRLIVARKVR